MQPGAAVARGKKRSSIAARLERVVTAALHIAERKPQGDDFQVLVAALLQPEVLEQESSRDPLASAVARGVAARTSVLEAEGGTWTTSDVAKHLDVERQAVDKRRRTGKLLALSLGRRGYVYPAWQFTRSGTLPGLAEVLKALSVKDPWMAAEFFLTGDPRLGRRTPLEEMRAGNVSTVLEAARGFGEHGAA